MKRDGWVYHRSSMLTALPALGALLLGSILCAWKDFFGAAAALMLVFVLAGCARLWGALALRGVTMAVDCNSEGVFPGQTLELHLRIHNNKLLPLVWMEMAFPLDEGLCLLPEEVCPADQWEVPTLREQGWCTEQIGRQRLSSCLWYEQVEVPTLWTAQHRGMYSMAGWRLRTGDGFGMAQVEQPVLADEVRLLAVYPALVPVRVEGFLQNLWNADTGSAGVMEDTTVIRSARRYQVGDRLKAINWRLTARGLPLTVNVYEDIMPRSLHFLVDGESFGGPESHWEELEQTLSILASVLVELTGRQVQCGLSLCQGQGRPVHINPQGSSLPMLRALAGYQPAAPVKEEGNRILRQTAVFDRPPLAELLQRVGRFYYIAYDGEGLQQQPVLQQLDEAMVTVLCWKEEMPRGNFRMEHLQALQKEGAA